MNAGDKTYKYYWEDFPVGSVREFGGLSVSKDEIIDFAAKFDPQPFHLDEAAAKHTLFGGLCASGWHTCGLAMRMMCDAYLLETASLGSPGLENIRWLKPVRPGDTLRVRSVVLEARPMGSKPDVGLFRTRWEMLNQDGDEVMQMEGWNMVRRRPA
jgi:acyl dehydratase